MWLADNDADQSSSEGDASKLGSNRKRYSTVSTVTIFAGSGDDHRIGEG